MAGSDQSGEEMQSGRTNRAEDHTRIWAQQEQGQPFSGNAIFIVQAAGDIEDDDFVLPSSRLHGIVGSGVSEGAGVIGLDAGHSDEDVSHVVNVGVFGRGETGVRGEGSFRGPGVEGLGGNHPFTAQFGTGVVGRGGRQRHRLFCPHRLGPNREGQLRVLCCQYAAKAGAGSVRWVRLQTGVVLRWRNSAE